MSGETTTAQEILDANIKTIRSANRGAHGSNIAQPMILVFDLSDAKVKELATHCFRGETPGGAVAVWAKPFDLTRNWLIRTYGDESLAGAIKPPETVDQIRALVFTAAGCEEITTC